MMITRYDTYMNGEMIAISVIITNISESDRRKIPQLNKSMAEFKDKLKEIVEQAP